MVAADVGEKARCGKRHGNEAILGRTPTERGLTETSGERLAFACECRGVGCFETAWMVEYDFRLVAHSEDVWLVAPGHCGADEDVIARARDYLLVSRKAHAPPPGGDHRYALMRTATAAHADVEADPRDRPALAEADAAEGGLF
jgi:hypothetical protein